MKVKLQFINMYEQNRNNGMLYYINSSVENTQKGLHLLEIKENIILYQSQMQRLFPERHVLN